MEPLTHKFLRRVIRLLEAIEREINEPPKKLPDTPSVAAETAQKTDQIPFLVSDRAEIRFDPALITQWNHNQQANNRWQRRSLITQTLLFLATLAAFIAAAIYADIANGQKVTMDHQWQTMKETLSQTRRQADIAKRSLDQAHDNFVAEQRPYMVTTKVLPERGSSYSEMAAGKPIKWHVEYQNFGRTPAVNIAGRSIIFFGESAATQVNGYFQRLPKTLGHKTGSEGFSAPNGLGDPGFTTALATKPPSSDDITFIRAHDFGIYVVGRIQYEDLEGNIYHTDFCYSTFLSGAIPMCSNHNEIH